MNEIITSRKNQAVTRLKKLMTDSGFRNDEGEFVCEGIKLYEEAIKWKAEIKMVFTSPSLLVAAAEGAKQFTVTREIIEYVSSQKSPQDIIFTCAMKAETPQVKLDANNILLENIQDPGNLGTILRSAGAFGIDSVILLGECADPYNPKTVRASMGAVFRKKIVSSSYKDVQRMIASGMRLYGAALGEESKTIKDVPLDGVTVAIGNEGSGLTETLLSLCREKVIIPIDSGCESLNAGVAAAIFMWEMSVNT